MIDDGLFDRFPSPDVVLGQHVIAGPDSSIGGRPGTITSAAGLYVGLCLVAIRRGWNLPIAHSAEHRGSAIFFLNHHKNHI